MAIRTLLAIRIAITAITAGASFMLGLALWTSSSTALTFNWKKSAEVSFSADSCDAQETRRITFPEGARDPELVSGPELGDVISDGFDDPVARVTGIELRNDEDGRHRIYVTVGGNGASCLDEDGEDYGWETDYARFVLGYNRDERLWFNEFYASGSERLTRQRPRWIKCGSDCGWRNLRWKSWGGRTARATGYFRYINKTTAGNSAIDYPVTVTLSRPAQCYNRVRYLRMSTHFTSSRPPWIRSNYKVERLGCARGIF